MRGSAGAATQKKTLIAAEQRREAVAAERERFRQEMKRVDPRDLVFVDETGVTTTMTRRYGRAPRGVRVVDAVPQGRWQVLTVLGAVTVDGVAAAMTIAAATDGDVFRAFVAQVLVPRLRPGQVVVLDNLGAHKVPGVREAIEAAGAVLHYRPPYSPDLNPIELAWSKLKTYLRGVKERTADQLGTAVGRGLRRITAQDPRTREPSSATATMPYSEQRFALGQL